MTSNDIVALIARVQPLLLHNYAEMVRLGRATEWWEKVAAALVQDNADLRQRLAESEAVAAALRDALECLEAEQNGPPLLGRHEKYWNAAMAKTKIALASTAATK